MPANVLLLDEPFLLCHRRAMRREHSPRQCYTPSLVWQACSFAMHDFAGDRMDEDIRRPIARPLKWHTPHATRGESCREGDHGQEGDGYPPCSLPQRARSCLASASRARVEQARASRVQAESNVDKAEAYPEAVA